MQFLIESITLSVVGAAIGLMGGIALVKVIAGLLPAGLPVSLFGLTVASGFAISIGLARGTLSVHLGIAPGAGGSASSVEITANALRGGHA